MEHNVHNDSSPSADTPAEAVDETAVAEQEVPEAPTNEMRRRVAKLHETRDKARQMGGEAKIARSIVPWINPEPPAPSNEQVVVWIRDGWGCSEKEVRDAAREAGADDPVLHVLDRKSTRLNSSHSQQSRMPSSA